MINKATAMEAVLERLKALPPGQAIDLRTYKRNRSVVIKRTGEDEFLIIQDGYEQARYTEPFKRMRKLLKALFKKEFPRSTKIRLYNLGEVEVGEAVQRKKI
ncbi:hypothetical protein [Salidesulfovibrio onnuriiensis]|uniref:hypothetical protein n=1 Tax=Salidesulfovibrio onnuriiensis TaxID=2583823 RepID=UPI0011C8517C|nr:hypothetical protein [Salidesulfovibrio onnuriiensis]